MSFPGKTLLNPWHRPQILTNKTENDFENILERGENAGNQHFLLFPQCFLLHQRQIVISSNFEIVFCKLMFSISVLAKVLSFGTGLTPYKMILASF